MRNNPLVQNGEVRFQVKATDNLRVNRGMVRCRVRTGDLHYWYWEDPPFVLVVYDAEKGRGFWLHLRGYIDDHPGLLESDQETITMRAESRAPQVSASASPRRTPSSAINARKTRHQSALRTVSSSFGSSRAEKMACHGGGLAASLKNVDIPPAYNTPEQRMHRRDMFLLSILLSTLFE